MPGVKDRGQHLVGQLTPSGRARHRSDRHALKEVVTRSGVDQPDANALLDQAADHPEVVLTRLGGITRRDEAVEAARDTSGDPVPREMLRSAFRVGVEPGVDQHTHGTADLVLQATDRLRTGATARHVPGHRIVSGPKLDDRLRRFGFDGLDRRSGPRKPAASSFEDLSIS